VIVAVPETEDVVGPHRAALDRAASGGVPAHVTVLYPFVPPSKIDDQVIRILADALQTVPAFRAAFPRVAWFGHEVVWLALDPVQPFRDLTSVVSAQLPGLPAVRRNAYRADPAPHHRRQSAGRGPTRRC
jgi:hypothetical protein